MWCCRQREPLVCPHPQGCCLFNWDESCQQAFDQLRMYLTTAPVLAYPDFSVDFKLDTDSSGAGLGVVLSQTQKDGSTRPIAFASCTLQSSKGITELEALAVVWAVKHFCQYLYGHKCQVITDHEALKSLYPLPLWQARSMGIDPAGIGSQHHLPPREEESQGRCSIPLPSSPGPSR